MTLLPLRLNFQQLQQQWASIINPLLSNPASNPSMLQNVSLASGNNSVNHGLGRPLQGWYITRMEGNYAQIHDTQNTNPYPALTLNLNSSAAVTVNIAVF